MLSRCVVEIHTLPVNQEYSLNILLLKDYWGLHSYRRDAQMAAKYLGYIRYIRKRFCKSTCMFISSLSSRIGFSLEENCWRTHSQHVYSGEKWKGAASYVYSGEMKDQNKIEILDASLDRQPKIQSSSVEETKRIVGQTNNDCRFLISMSSQRQQPLFVGREGSRPRYVFVHNLLRKRCIVDAVDELRFSSSTRGISMPNFEVLDAGIVSVLHNSQFRRRISLEKKGPERGPVSFAAESLPIWSTIISGSLEPMILSKTTPTYSQSVYEMMIFKKSILGKTEFIVHDENPAWWNRGRIIQIKNARIWEKQDRIGILRSGESSEENRTWLSQIENDGEKKYRERNSK